MKAGIISLGSTSSKWVYDAMKKYFDSVDPIDIRHIEVSLSGENPQVLYKGKELSGYDCIYAKGSFRYEPLLRAITSALQLDTYMPIRARGFTLAHDKLLSQLVMQNAKVPMPTTYLTSTIEAAREILKKVNYPIIMKFPKGTQGKGVLFADSYGSASSMLDALSALRQPFIIQQYVETGGVDIRAIVIGDKVVASMKRKAQVGEKRANIHRGGTGEKVVLDPQTRKIAVEATKAVGADICAVDFLEDIKGPVVIEVNVSPGLQGITKTTEIDVADKIARFLFEKAKEFKAEKDKQSTKEIMKTISGPEKQIITNLDFRSQRILLSKLISQMSGFNEKDEVVIKVKENKITIEKFG